MDTSLLQIPIGPRKLVQHSTALVGLFAGFAQTAEFVPTYDVSKTEAREIGTDGCDSLQASAS